MEPEHHEGRGEYFLPPCVPLTLILSLLVFSSSPLYATTALLPRSLKRQLWLCGPFHDAIFFWGGESPHPVPASSPEGGHGSSSHQAPGQAKPWALLRTEPQRSGT